MAAVVTGVADAGVDAGSPLARLIPARPVRSCPSFDECVHSCKAPELQGTGCYEAALYALEGNLDGGRNFELVTLYAAMACDKGDGRGCVRAQRPGDALKALPAQCERADVEACELLATLQQGVDAGTEARTAADRAMTLLQEACEKNDPFACGRLGSAWLHGRFGKPDVTRAVPVLDKSCRAGVAGSCIELVFIYGNGVETVGASPSKAAQYGKMARELSGN